MPSKHFHDLLEQMKTIHDRKSHDYASANDNFSNFKTAAELTQHFSNTIDQVFASIIGIKLARLAELLSSQKTPNNESVDDSFIDLANYCALWGAFYREKRGLEDLVNKAVEEDIKKCFEIRKPESFNPVQINRQD